MTIRAGLFNLSTNKVIPMSFGIKGTGTPERFFKIPEVALEFLPLHQGDGQNTALESFVVPTSGSDRLNIENVFGAISTICGHTGKPLVIMNTEDLVKSGPEYLRTKRQSEQTVVMFHGPIISFNKGTGDNVYFLVNDHWGYLNDGILIEVSYLDPQRYMAHYLVNGKLLNDKIVLHGLEQYIGKQQLTIDFKEKINPLDLVSTGFINGANIDPESIKTSDWNKTEYIRVEKLGELMLCITHLESGGKFIFTTKATIDIFKEMTPKALKMMVDTFIK